MNYFRVQSALFAGIQAVPVLVECAQSRRLPYVQVLGGGGSVAGELRERVIAALGTLHGGKFRLPARRITVQIVPGAGRIPLESLDLAVATAILGSVGQVSAERVKGVLICGRLGLDGSLEAVGSPASIRRGLREAACESALLPWEGSEALEDAELGRGGGFRTLESLLAFLQGAPKRGRRAVGIAPAVPSASASERIWARVAGEDLGRRSIEISAAGRHHLLLPGPSGERAQQLAEAAGLLLPPLGAREADEVRDVYALAGAERAPTARPFHVFGSRPALPALLGERRGRGHLEEIVLAHHGVLFFDQACERDRQLFPGLLPPMLQGALPARFLARRTAVPADVLVVAATPSCSCGAGGDPGQACVCRPTEARRYTERWRRLLRYPFDLCLQLAPATSRRAGEEGWGQAAARVAQARQRMVARFGLPNGQLAEGAILDGLPWGAGARRLWGALERRCPGQRPAYLALARLSATICDLREGSEISEADLHEALYFFPGGEAGAGSGRAASVSAAPSRNSMAMP